MRRQAAESPRGARNPTLAGEMKFWLWHPALPLAAAALLALLAYRLGQGLHAENERLRAACGLRGAGGEDPGRPLSGKRACLLFAAGPSLALFTAFLVGLHSGLVPAEASEESQAGRVILLVDALPPPASPAPPPPPAPVWTPPGCRPLSYAAARRLVERVAGEEGVPGELVFAVLYRESRLYPCAVSRSGAAGLMQLKPATARLVGVRDYWDPEENVRGGARYLRLLLERFDGNVTLALGAYHAGPGRVSRYIHLEGLPVTRRYVGDVLTLAGALAGD